MKFHKLVKKFQIYRRKLFNLKIASNNYNFSDGCKYIAEMKLVNCLYIGNQALNYLNLLKNSLEYLQIENCGLITDEGLHSLTELTYVNIN